jgi:hypothetical protein
MFPSPQYALSLYAAQLRAAKRVVDALVHGTERMDHILLQAAKETLHAQLEQAERAIEGGPFVPDPTLMRDRVVFRSNELMRAWTDTFGEIMRASQSWALESRAMAANGIESAVPGFDASAMANPLGGLFAFWNDAYRQLGEVVTRSRDLGMAAAPPVPASDDTLPAPRRPSARSRG